MTLNNDLLIWILGGVGGFILLLMRTTIAQMQAQINQLTAHVTIQDKTIESWQLKYQESHEAQVKLLAENGRLRRRLDQFKNVIEKLVPQSSKLLNDTDEYYEEGK